MLDALSQQNLHILLRLFGALGSKSVLV